ncbi:hypothetical protein OROGR_002288 [Orobanche gracilis]
MRNKTDDFRTADGKSSLPKKRNFCPKTDAFQKRRKSKSSRTSTLESSLLDTNDSSSSSNTKKSIGGFFYESGLDFGAVNLPTFQKMVTHFSDQTSRQIIIPTCQELRGWIFEDALKEMHEYVDDIKNSWADTGCTILLDGWKDSHGHDLINILVECPKGTVYLRSSNISDIIGDMDAMLLFFDQVVKEVGINNIIQVMTCSVSPFMKEVGKKLMEKYRPLFWTVSASECVELMLEKLKGVDLIKETLKKTKIITRFIYGHPVALKLLRDQTDGRDLVVSSKTRSMRPFLILENIVLEKEILKKIFLSSDLISKKREGKKVANLISDRLFWIGASTTLQAAIPLVRAIEWMDRNKKEQIGYIYETIDQVKETIKEGFKSRKSQYMQFWKVIDEVWTEVLYSPLHSAGYFFNPNLFYSSDVYIDPEVATGVLCCIVRATEDLNVQNRITFQMEKYRNAAGSFSLGCAGDQRFDVSPVDWWSEYGVDCPELQSLAVRILSQTCDGASKFRLERTSAEKLLTKGRSRTEQKRLADVLFLRYNMHLKHLASSEIDDMITSDETDLMDDDWITDEVAKDVSEYGDLEVEKGVIDLDGPSFIRPKVETV